jgi:hypothetical protein
MTTVVLDHTALLAIRGNQNVSRAIATAPETDARLVVPALSLLGAAIHDPPIADHVGSLHRVDIADLGLAAVGFTARLIADGVDWRFAHAIEVARVGPLQPQGLLVMTSEPGVYRPFGIETFTI